MSTIIRKESAHSINGVPGRMHNVVVFPGTSRIANQTWLSESRKIAGFGEGGLIRVEIKFDDYCKNGHETFSICATVSTSKSRRRDDIEAGGQLRGEIAEVFPELVPLIKYHLVSTDGPMHYIANALYHAKQHGPQSAWVYYKGTSPSDPLGLGEDSDKERLLGYLSAEQAAKAEGQPGYRIKWDEKTAKVRNLEHARSSACWPEATDDELSVDSESLKSKLIARLPGLMMEFRDAVTNAGFIWPEQIETPA